jgi:hypothetical protein
MRAVFEVLGIGDVVAKSVGTSNAHNMVHATLEALKQASSPRQIAGRRGVKIGTLIGSRDGAKAEENKEGAHEKRGSKTGNSNGKKTGSEKGRGKNRCAEVRRDTDDQTNRQPNFASAKPARDLDRFGFEQTPPHQHAGRHGLCAWNDRNGEAFG